MGIEQPVGVIYMQSKNRNRNENIIGVLIVIGTLTVYHFLSIETTVIPGLFHYLPQKLIPYFFVVLPGVLCGCIFAMFTRNMVKILLAGILTIILWIYWFSAIFPALTL
ncbi:hypothetical protein [Methanococcoides sp. NM1]|uniref:hypothetical protein n=1 Tax=Methanococcoides sp. NM1 TaxID=1201013 RepID=UPI001083B333|nr:hypothetical protein [Methanococcoides sp. NM1]